MEWYWILLALLGSILILMFIGFPVGIAFVIVCTVTAYLIYGRFGSFDANLQASVFQLTDNAFSNLSIFAIVPIPMFLLMGELFFHTGLANRMFNAVELLMGRVPARLSYVTIAGGTALATLSGSSMGSTALLGTLMVPEMTKRGYKKSMSIGPILGTGGLAMLIPPSALAVLLGTIAEIDIGKLLIAGIIPGVVLALMYTVMIFVRVTIDPDLAPAYDVDFVPYRTRLVLLVRDILPMVSIIAMVIGLIMGGIATPSEAAAYGSVGVLILAVIFNYIPPLVATIRARFDAWRRDGGIVAADDAGVGYWLALTVHLLPRLVFALLAGLVLAVTSPVRFLLRPVTPALGRFTDALHDHLHQGTLFERNVVFARGIWKSLWGAGRVTIIALMILLGSSLFANVLAASGASDALIKWVTSFDVSGYVMLLMMFGILLLLGMFMDQLAMMLLTVPIFFPVIETLNFGLPLDVTQIWFGVIMLLAMEISFTTPPFGLLLFVMQGVAPKGTKFSEICLAAIPFMACAMLLVALIIIFPGIATWLPWVKF